MPLVSISCKIGFGVAVGISSSITSALISSHFRVPLIGTTIITAGSGLLGGSFGYGASDPHCCRPAGDPECPRIGPYHQDGGPSAVADYSA